MKSFEPLGTVGGRDFGGDQEINADDASVHKINALWILAIAATGAAKRDLSSHHRLKWQLDRWCDVSDQSDASALAHGLDRGLDGWCGSDDLECHVGAATTGQFSTIDGYTEPDSFDPRVELSEQWLADLSRDSRNQLQFSHPSAVVAENLGQAFEKLWGQLIVESIPTKRTSMTKATVTARYINALTHCQVDHAHMKRRVILETSKTHTNIDVAVHNGVVKDITQCWSLQIKSAELLLNDIKAWGWTIKTLRDQGGTILTRHDSIEVPRDVRVGIVYAPSDVNALMDEALDVFNDPQIHADCVTVEQATQHAQAAANLVIHQPGLDFGT